MFCLYILLIISFLWKWLCNKVETRKDFRFYYFWLYFVYQNFQNGYFRISLFAIFFQSCQLYIIPKHKACNYSKYRPDLPKLIFFSASLWICQNCRSSYFWLKKTLATSSLWLNRCETRRPKKNIWGWAYPLIQL